MSKIEEFRSTAGTRGKNLLNTVADILEDVAKQNLEFRNELAGFAVSQLRLPTQVSDFADYRDRSRAAYSELGTSLKDHGKGLIDSLRDMPGQVKDTLLPPEKPAKAKAKAKTVAKPAKAKPVAKKAAAKKAAPKKAA